MMQKRKSPEELKIIDCFIAMYYPTKGPDYCASNLKESRAWITSRACLKKIKFIQPEGKKYETKLEEIERLKENNAALRKENMILIVQNLALKASLGMVLAAKQPDPGLIGGMVSGDNIGGDIVTVNEVNELTGHFNGKTQTITFTPENIGEVINKITKGEKKKKDSL